MDLRDKLCIIHNDGGTETDYSMQAQDFKRDSFSIQLTTDDFIYVGYEKLINALYIQMNTPNTIASSLTVEYYSESGWATLEACDETLAFTRNGFITWERPTDGANVTVAGKELCWFRISSNDDIDAVDFEAISLLFSDDHTICAYEPSLNDPCFYAEGETSHLLRHLAARNYIMSKIRRKYSKEEGGVTKNVNMWDVLDIFEIREAANYYAISQIYFNLAEGPDDAYWAKYVEYKEMFDEAMSLGILSIDQNGDGQANESEKRPIQMTRLAR